MAAGEIRAGRAFVEIATKNNLSKELDKISAKLKAFGSAFQELGKKMLAGGIAITAPLVLASMAFAKMGKEMEEASERTGIAVESLSALSYAAEQSGASMEDLEKALGKMEKSIFEAAGGSTQLQGALRAVNVTVAELKGMSPENRFLTIADALGKVTEQSTKTGLAMEIFGKGAAALLPMFNGGAEGARKLVEHAKALGIVMSGEDAQAAKAWSNTLDDLVQQFKMITFQVGAAISSALNPFASSAQKIMRSVIDWTKANKPLIIELLTFGAAIVAGGAALVALGTAFVAAGAAIGGVTTVVGVVGSAIGFLMSPIVLVIGGLTALASYFAYSSGAGGEALAWLGARFDELRDIANESFGGIADALAAGDISLAAKTLWTGLKLAWKTGTQSLMSYWYAFKDVIVHVAADTFFGILEIWTIVSSNLQIAFTNAAGTFKSVWHAAIGEVADKFDWLSRAQQKLAVHTLLVHGEISEAEANKRKQLIDDQFDHQKATRRKEEMQVESTAGTDNAKRLKEIKDQRDKTLISLVDRNKSIDNAADQNKNDDSLGDQNDIQQLHTQLRQLRAQAKREHSAGLKLPGKPELNLNDPTQGSAKGPGGIFNIAALASLQSSSPLSAIEKNTKETSQKLTFIIGKKGLVFG